MNLDARAAELLEELAEAEVAAAEHFKRYPVFGIYSARACWADYDECCERKRAVLARLTEVAVRRRHEQLQRQAS